MLLEPTKQKKSHVMAMLLSALEGWPAGNGLQQTVNSRWKAVIIMTIYPAKHDGIDHLAPV
jgi:hypothetical protein